MDCGIRFAGRLCLGETSLNIDRENAPVPEEEFQLLITQAKAGDADAIGKLLSKYRNYLLLIANQDLDDGLRSKLGASDVVQETMLLAQQKFEQFRGDSEKEFLGWLKKILANDMHNNRRQYATQKRDAGLEQNLQAQSSMKQILVDGNLTPSSDALQRERAKVLAEALKQLSEDHRQVIQLRNFEQLDFSEVGNRMDRSADAARKLWARAIESLHAQLSHFSPELLSGIFKATTEQE